MVKWFAVVAVSVFWLPGFANAQDDVESANSVLAQLEIEGANPQGKKSAGVEAGILDGFPYLRLMSGWSVLVVEGTKRRGIVEIARSEVGQGSTGHGANEGAMVEDRSEAK